MIDAYTVMMTLAFVAIFIAVHLAFQNIRQICLVTCKVVTALYMWICLWIVTQLHALPEWKEALSESVWELYNITSEKISL